MLSPWWHRGDRGTDVFLTEPRGHGDQGELGSGQPAGYAYGLVGETFGRPLVKDEDTLEHC